MACWSSGQDDALSRRKPGFDSRTGHLLLRYAAAFFKGASVAQLVEHRYRKPRVISSTLVAGTCEVGRGSRLFIFK